MVDVKHISRHSTFDGFVKTTAYIGVVNDNTPDAGVYVLKEIYTPTAPETYGNMVSCVAASMEAMRGQYNIVKDRSIELKQNTWENWFKIATCLTWSKGYRHVLYKINPINGLPALVDCRIEYNAPSLPTSFNSVAQYKQINACFEYVQKYFDMPEYAAVPHQAFSQYGTTTGAVPRVGFSTLPELQHGIDTPLVANQHMKVSDSPELHWVNVAMHMVSDATNVHYIAGYTMTSKHQNVTDAFTMARKAVESTSIATQVMAPYPVQWRTSQPALAQAMEVATAKLVGEQNYKRFFGPPGSAMNVAMGAAHYVMRPHTNQMHLKALYSQDDRVMPMDSAAAFVRDITATGVRNRYLQSLMMMGVT